VVVGDNGSVGFEPLSKALMQNPSWQSSSGGIRVADHTGTPTWSRHARRWQCDLGSSRPTPLRAPSWRAPTLFSSAPAVAGAAAATNPATKERCRNGAGEFCTNASR